MDQYGEFIQDVINSNVISNHLKEIEPIILDIIKKYHNDPFNIHISVSNKLFPIKNEYYSNMDNVTSFYANHIHDKLNNEKYNTYKHPYIDRYNMTNGLVEHLLHDNYCRIYITYDNFGYPIFILMSSYLYTLRRALSKFIYKHIQYINDYITTGKKVKVEPIVYLKGEIWNALPLSVIKEQYLETVISLLESEEQIKAKITPCVHIELYKDKLYIDLIFQ